MDEKRVVVCAIPSPGAPLDELVEFAHTYNGYERLGATPEDLHRVIGPILAAALDEGRVPAWAGLDLIRGALFYLARSTRHMGSG